MVGVRGVSGGTVAGAGRAARSASGFSLGIGQAGAAAAQGLAPTPPIGLLALQEGQPAAERDARARRRAEAGLRGLRALQLGLLDGGPDPAALEALLDSLPAAEEAADPALATALAAIRLRVQVELARRGLSPG